MSRPAALTLAPVLMRQGRLVRERTPLLPEPPGDRFGLEPSAGTTDALRLTVVGESTAAGVGVEDQRDALPHCLAVELAERWRRRVEWNALARTGATAGVAARELAPAAPRDQDIVVIVLGVNDAMKIIPRKTWRARMNRLIDTLQQHLRPGGQVVLAGLPNLGHFRTFPHPLRAILGWHSRALDRDLRRIAEQRSAVIHVPMPAVTWPTMFADDLFHPNAPAYRAWAIHLADALDRYAYQPFG
jgi:lysophospholipase L1-like esterase